MGAGALVSSFYFSTHFGYNGDMPCRRKASRLTPKQQKGADREKWLQPGKRCDRIPDTNTNVLLSRTHEGGFL
jgi:hypothetical protein